MKQINFLILASFLLFWGCSQPEPLIEQKAQVEMCHLQADAMVDHRVAGHEGSKPFYYLMLLNEQGIQIEDVFPTKLPDQFKEIGTRVRIIYHYAYNGDHSYINACGPGGDGKPIIESMKKVVICEMEEGAS